MAFKSPKGRRGDPYPEGRVEELMAEWSLYLQNFVVKAHGTPQVHWLGLSDREHEGDWKWLDGSPVTLRQVFRVLGLSAHFLKNYFLIYRKLPVQSKPADSLESQAGLDRRGTGCFYSDRGSGPCSSLIFLHCNNLHLLTQLLKYIQSPG